MTFVYWGHTGTGKTRLAHILTKRRAWVSPSNVWFDGYEGQEDVIFDDFSSEDMNRGMFLRLFDRYPMTVPVKGGFVNWTPKRAFITSNVEPANWYDNDPAILRRLDGIFRFVQ